MEFVDLVGGPAVPVLVLELAWSLERRGYTFAVVDDSLRLRPAADGSSQELTDDDRTQIRQWKLHLMAVATYKAPTDEVFRTVSDGVSPNRNRTRNKAKQAKH